MTIPSDDSNPAIGASGSASGEGSSSSATPAGPPATPPGPPAAPAGTDDDLFRIAVDLSPSGLLAVDAGGIIVLANREIERLFGYSREELLGQPIEMIVPMRMQGAHPRLRDAYFASPSERPMGAGRDLHGLHRNGTEIPVEIGLKPVKAARGLLVLASVVDITARKREEERFQAAVESAPSGMIMADSDGRIVLVNREVERLFGWRREELMGQRIEVLVPERFRAGHPGLRESYSRDPRARPMGAGRELRGLRKDGSEMPIEIGLNPLKTEEGTYILSSVVDITARREAEALLRESEERFRLLVDGLHDYAVFMLDPDGLVASWNVGAEHSLGHRSSEMIGRHLSVLFADEGGADAVLEHARESGRAQADVNVIRQDGVVRVAETVVTALRDDQGRLRGFAQILRDVTAQRAIEERLRQTQKLEAIGTLAGGVAHDFNNMLAGIVGYTELAIHGLGDRPDAQADLGNVLRAAERGRDLVKRILTFSRGDERTLRPIRLQAILKESLGLLRSTLPASIEIREHLDPRAPPIKGDATEMQQLVMNLATNAAQAMASKGGVLDVSLTPCRVDADSSLASEHPEISPGLFVRLTIADTGMGMTPELQGRIFEPFFTTKDRGSGTGLGLAIVHGIVRSHDGALTLESAPGQGATFCVYLPVHLHEHEEAAPVVEEPGKERAHVLYCEDEEFLASLAERQLIALGYRVTMHTSSLEALEDFHARPGEFDVVITDNTMPHMTGMTLSQEMLRIRPDLPIIMVSGLGLSMSQDSVRAFGIRHILPKPHRREDLARLLEEILKPGDANPGS